MFKAAQFLWLTDLINIIALWRGPEKGQGTKLSLKVYVKFNLLNLFLIFFYKNYTYATNN